MSRKTKHWIYANLAAALFGYCGLQLIRYDGGVFYLLFGAINFYLVWLNVKGALSE